MKTIRWFACSVLCAAAVSVAEITVPQGKGFGSLDIPPPDSFLISGSEEHSYVDMELTGVQAIQYFGIVFPEGGYQIDTIRKTVTSSMSGYMVTEDSAGLPWSARMVAGTGPLGVSSVTRRQFDGQGRPIVEITTISIAEDGDQMYDTIHWTWTHPQCADDREGDTLRIWSVDAQGRCASADVREVTASGSQPTGFTDHFLWKGEALAGSCRLDGTDTLLKDDFVVDGNGNVTEQVSWEKQGNIWVLTDRDSFVYRDGKLYHVKQNGYQDGRQVMHMLFQSVRGQVGIGIASGRETSWIQARREGDAVTIANRSTESVVVDLLDARGRRVHALTVGAGSTATWGAAPNGPLFWRARGAIRETSGKLPGLR